MHVVTSFILIITRYLKTDSQQEDDPSHQSKERPTVVQSEVMVQSNALVHALVIFTH